MEQILFRLCVGVVLVGLAAGANIVKRDVKSDIEEVLRMRHAAAMTDDVNSDGNTDDMMKALIQAIRQQKLGAAADDDDVDDETRTNRKRFWGEVSDWFKGAADDIGGWFKGAGESIADFFGGALDFFARQVGIVGDRLKKIAQAVSPTIRDQLSKLRDEANKIVKDIEANYNAASGGAKTAAGKLLALAKAQRDQVVSRFNNVQSQLCNGVMWRRCSSSSQCTSSTCSLSCRKLFFGSFCF